MLDLFGKMEEFFRDILITIIYTNTAFAQVKESEVEKEAEQVQEKIEEEKILRFPNKLEAKEPPKNSQENPNSSNNKGIATEPSTSKAQLIESVNNANEKKQEQAKKPIYQEGMQVKYQGKEYVISEIQDYKTYKTIKLDDNESYLNGFITGGEILAFRKERELDLEIVSTTEKLQEQSIN